MKKFDDMAKKSEWTEKQFETLEFIREFYVAFKFPPTVQEIATHHGIAIRAAQDRLAILRRKGYVIWDEGKARTMRVLK